MGEIAEAMLDGTLCAGCGEALIFDAETEPAGFPQYCSEQCARNHGVDPADDDEEFSLPKSNSNPTVVRQQNEARRAEGVARWRCPDCSKGLRTKAGLKQHMIDKHKSPQLTHADFIAVLMPFAKYVVHVEANAPLGRVPNDDVHALSYGGDKVVAVTWGDLRAARKMVERATGKKVEP